MVDKFDELQLYLFHERLLTYSYLSIMISAKFSFSADGYNHVKNQYNKLFG